MATEKSSLNPTPAEIRAAREAAKLSQTAAGELIHTTCRTWQQWEAGDRKMHPAFWELFRVKSATLVLPRTNLQNTLRRFLINSPFGLVSRYSYRMEF